ncbi:MAG: DUF192 domain-containing protein [Candidatus Cloacimonetes bacterium]|nr:DUF192 domain-containing protein [Candidatus Cloacimonadota bacterium]
MAKRNRNQFKRQQNLKRKKIRNRFFRVTLIIVILLGIYLIFQKNIEEKSIDKSYNQFEAFFKKEGRLVFICNNSNETIQRIDIEVADNDYERAQGLMWRYSMSDSVGMLFIFDYEKPRSFWMKNTYIPLDIIFLNVDLEIVSIQKFTEPLSELSIPSYQPSKYVIEVNAGFCDKYGISEGDKVKFELSNLN